MGKVIAQASMSLDRFIADTNDEVDPLFDWSKNGDGEVTGGHPEFRTSAASAAYLRQAWSTIGVDVIGRQVPCGGEKSGDEASGRSSSKSGCQAAAKASTTDAATR